MTTQKRLWSNTATEGHRGLYTPSGGPQFEDLYEFLRNVADRIDRLADTARPSQIRELNDLAHECRVKIGMS